MARPAIPRFGVVGLDLRNQSTNLGHFLTNLDHGRSKLVVYFKVVKNFDYFLAESNPLYYINLWEYFRAGFELSYMNLAHS
jgi:hypothetical protein